MSPRPLLKLGPLRIWPRAEKRPPPQIQPRPQIKRVEWVAEETAIYVNGERLDEPIRMTIIESTDGKLVAAFAAVER